MKVSIVTAILNSHEIVRRQMLHYEKMGLPPDVEVVFVDDGSDPPIDFGKPKFNFTGLATNDFRHWTQPAARNMGARNAQGAFLILTDIDHIITQQVIDFARDCPFDVVRFKRQVAVLDENGDMTQDPGVLAQYGFTRNSPKIAPHGNSYIMRAGIYRGLGGVDERYVGTGKYPNREEVPLKRKLFALKKQGRVEIVDDDRRPTIYMIPNGKYSGDRDANPFGLFHGLSRERNIGRLTNKQKRRKANA